MRRLVACSVGIAVWAIGLSRVPARAACCYFAAIARDVDQPGQKAFVTWDPAEKIESFTVQPRFRGSVRSFGMVIPTPGRPRLYEMPRSFFRELAVFTILKTPQFGGGIGGSGGFAGGLAAPAFRGGGGVRVLEAGVVGALDYRIVTAEQSGDLYTWLKENLYAYSGDEATLDFYIQKRWYFTVMKIDPLQMRRGGDGRYLGEITPTRFVFPSDKAVYPLRITQLSVRDQTNALFYVQAPFKADLGGLWSYQYQWAPLWGRMMDLQGASGMTEPQKQWKKVVDGAMPALQKEDGQIRELLPGWTPTSLEYAHKLDRHDMELLDGKVSFDRSASAREVHDLPILRGHLREGQWLTKFSRTFRKDQMNLDLEFTPSTLNRVPDEMPYDTAFTGPGAPP